MAACANSFCWGLGVGEYSVPACMETMATSAARKQAADVFAHALRIHHGDAKVHVVVIAVRLIVGVGEEAEADAVANQHRALVRQLRRFRRADGGDAVAGQPVQRELHSVAAAIAGVIVGGGNDVDPGGFQRFDHFRLGLEDHSGFDQAARGRKRAIPD